MHPCFQDKFVTCDEHQDLRYEGTWLASRWANGVLRTPDGTVYAQVQNGVPLFVPPGEDPWGDDEAVAKQLERYRVYRETLIPTNWQNALTRWR